MVRWTASAGTTPTRRGAVATEVRNPPGWSRIGGRVGVGVAGSCRGAYPRPRATRDGDGADTSGRPSVRTAEPERPNGDARTASNGASKNASAPSSDQSQTGARPKRRRGRPVARKPLKPPVPGDAMGIASLLWQLAREDEQILGRARIQPHGLESVVPRSVVESSRDDAPASKASKGPKAKIDLDVLATLVAEGRSTTDIAERVGVTRAAVRKARAKLIDPSPRHSLDQSECAPSDGGYEASGSEDETDTNDTRTMPLYKRAGRRKNGAGDEERRKMAARQAGVTRTADTRRRISAKARERWRTAREKATADKTAQVAAAVDQLRREAATAAARLKSSSGSNERVENGKDSDDGSKNSSNESEKKRRGPATHSSALPSYNASAPWEWLAQGAGTASAEEYALGDSPADRAAAFAALLNDKHGGIGGVLASGDFENFDPSSLDEGDGSFDAPDSFTKAFPGAYIPGVQGMPGVSFDEDDEDEDDEELREKKRRMKKKLAKLAARRAEVVGDGTPRTAKVTVAKFTNELKAFTQLRDDLSDWSDVFLARNGRRPTVKDAERTGIDFLVKSFKEYVELRDRLMSQTPYLRGQMEDVAKETLPTPRVTRDGVRRGRAGIRGDAGTGGASRAAGGATPRPTVIFSSPPQGGGILGASGYGHRKPLPPAQGPERRNRSQQPRNK